MRKLLVLLVASLASVPAALADVPPPEGYVETCTVEKACAKGEEATACRTFFKEPQKCKNELAKDGWARKCKTRGASAWTEVWCRTRPVAPKAAEPK